MKGRVHIPTSPVRTFTAFRQITRGRDAGKIEVTLDAIPARKVIVTEEAILSYPMKSITGKPLSKIDFAQAEGEIPGLEDVPTEGEKGVYE